VVISCKPRNPSLGIDVSYLVSSADLGGGHQGTTMTWSKAVLPEKMFGQDVSLSLQDADGNEAWSDSVHTTL
jgi:hypothetical protein